MAGGRAIGGTVAALAAGRLPTSISSLAGDIETIAATILWPSGGGCCHSCGGEHGCDHCSEGGAVAGGGSVGHQQVL